MSDSQGSSVKELHFIATRGISLHSRFVSGYTKGVSHVAFKPYTDSWELIEAWNHKGGLKIYWDYSDLANHSKGTEWELWSLPVSEYSYNYVQDVLHGRADKKEGYGWWQIFGFGIPFYHPQGALRVCSTGIMDPLAESRACTRLPGTLVDPEEFIGIIEFAGASMIDHGVI